MTTPAQQRIPQQQQQQQQQQVEHTQMPQRIKCGEVYSWDCAGELYGVECALCEERPLCTLAEFAEHMDIWHSCWTEASADEAHDNDDKLKILNEVEEWQQLEESEMLPMTEKVCDVVDVDDEDADSEDAFSIDSLEPFEQVLIADDTVSTTTSYLTTNIEDMTTNAEDLPVEEPEEIQEIAMQEAVMEEVETIVKENVAKNDANATNDLNVDDIALENYIADCIDLADAMQYSSEEAEEAEEWYNAESGFDEESLHDCHEVTQSKLTRVQLEKLIELYRSQPRLWNQKHPEFWDTQLCRESWQQLTQQWNEYCDKDFTTADVRIRMSTLCQRYLKERNRPSEHVNFTYYKQLQFLDEQQTYIDRRLIFEQQNSKLLEIYEHFPMLWQRTQKHTRQPAERLAAYRNIHIALKLCGIHLPLAAIQRRLQTLRKLYRQAKIQQLQCHLACKTFETNFKHYKQMQFLYEHIEPFVCADCGKIYKNLVGFREHGKVAKHGENKALQAVESVEKEAEELCAAEEAPLQEGYEKNVIDENIAGKEVETYTTYEALVENELTELAPDNVEIEQLTSTTNLEPTSCQNTINQKTENQTMESEEREGQEADNDLAKNSANDLIVKVQCANFSYDLKLSNNIELEEPRQSFEPQNLIATESAITAEAAMSTSIEKVTDVISNSKTEGPAKIDNTPESFARLTVEQTRQLIALYQEYPQLWDPRHLDYQCRKLRRIAWHMLTTRLNKIYKMHYTWTTLHRKLSDYLKYYKREKQRIETEQSCTKWCFYDDFAFMDEVLNNCTPLQQTQLSREHNFKIIELYRNYPQLWDTYHAEYSKRHKRHSYVVSMCARLKADYDIHVTAAKLKQRLIEYRCNYRVAKRQRLAALKRNEAFTPQFEYYEALQFLDLHVAPFICAICGAQYKRHTDFLQHKRKQHAPKKRNTLQPTVQDDTNAVTSTTDDSAAVGHSCKSAALDNVCHICGITFTLRSNLVYHLNRHMNSRAHACSMCPKKFFNSTALRVHERSHTKSKPYICEQCGRAYINGSKLNQHLKRHRNQRDFPCSQCGKAFFTAFERERHARRHQNIRDKVCNICDKTFVAGSAYYTHMLLHSDVKRYACMPCGQEFAQYAGLYKHRKRYHNNE